MGTLSRDEASTVLGIPKGELTIVPEHAVLAFCHARVAGQMVEAAIALHGLPATGGQLPGVLIELRIPPGFPPTFQIHPKAAMRLGGGPAAQGRIGIEVRPNLVGFRSLSAPATPLAEVGIGFDFKPGAPTVLLGDPNGSRLDFAAASLDLTAGVANGAWSVLISADSKGFKFVLDPGEGDGFLRFLIGGDRTEIGLPLGLEWSQDGIRFEGSASLRHRGVSAPRDRAGVDR